MDMIDLAKYLPPYLIKGERYEADNWKFHDQELMFSEIRVSIKDVLPSSMQDELDNHQEEYCSLTHEYWCDLLSKIKVNYNREIAETHIKKIASDREASLSDSNGSVRIPKKNKARLGDGFLRSNKVHHNKAPKHHGIQRHCVLCKNSGISE